MRQNLAIKVFVSLLLVIGTSTSAIAEDPLPILTIANPEGVSLLGTREVSMNGQSEFQPSSDPLGGVSGCTIQNGQTHVYGTISFSVTTAGNYTFRVVSSNPAMTPGSDSNPYKYAEYNTDSDSNYVLGSAVNMPPTGDMMLALYTTAFDPAHPDDNVLGCNDDSARMMAVYPLDYESSGAIYSASNQYLNLKFPEFSVSDLAVGDYTILLTTWSDAYSASSWASKNFGTQSATFEFWGPVGGLTFAESSSAPAAPQVAAPVAASEEVQPVLAKTGATDSPLLALALILMFFGYTAYSIGFEEMRKQAILKWLNLEWLDFNVKL